VHLSVISTNRRIIIRTCNLGQIPVIINFDPGAKVRGLALISAGLGVLGDIGKIVLSGVLSRLITSHHLLYTYTRYLNVV
jgi:energy-converting hydrogenase Eha subunit C